MSPWQKKKEKIPTADHFPNIASTLNRIPPRPLASTDPIMAQVQGISGAGPSFSNPQGSVIAKEDKEEKGQVLPGRWRSTASTGQKEAFDQVCNFLKDDKVGMVGIYGMGGVGKTTLMKKIRKEYLEPSNFKVIWVVVSKSIDIDNIQKDIMEGMELPFNKSESRHTRADKINEALNQKKVALLFDDIWECLGPTELEEIGMLGPTELDPSILKMVFTTRSEKVCDQMEPDEQIMVECLGWDDSWALFEKIVGRKILESDYEIEPIAKKIAEECKGLPLALTVIGRAMKGKKYRRQWEYALRTLQQSSSKDQNTEEQLFARLKLSYDTLPDNGEKNCFLYCCLFPEDEEIEGDQLIEYWIAEGYLALSGRYLEVSNRGVDIIGTLQAACLLERVDRGYGGICVKMHDVVRDMGLWIASKLTLNFFIHGSSQLIKSEVEEKWREAHRIYVRRGDGFPEQPLCPNLTTLIIDLAGERIKILNSFFNSMGKLRVLKLDYVDFVDKKVEIGQLIELRYLSVCNSNLRILPTDIIKLSKLEVLYLRNNNYFEWVPENSIRHLVELRKLALHLHSTRKLTFDAVIMEVGYLSKLEILKMHFVGCYYATVEPEGRVVVVNSEEAEDRVDMGQLCDSLRDLDMWGWPFAGPGELVSALEQMDKLVVLKIGGDEIRGVLIFTSGLLPSLKTLKISDCHGLEKIEVSPRAFENIRELEIHWCISLECIVGLEHLRRTLVKLTIIGGKMDDDEPARTLKRPRLVWTPQLHKRFVDAVAHLGIKNAVPKTIMQLMSVDGLTRENVASHLQKYRVYLKRMQGLSSSAAAGGAAAGPFAGPVELVSALEQLDKLVFLKIGNINLRGVVIFPSGFLPSLKTLQISHCSGLEMIEVSPRAFENIRELSISHCFSLKCIVGLEHLRSTLVKLTIENVDEMEELMMEGGAAATAALSFPTLKYMKLRGLRKLKSICSDDVQFPSLTTFYLKRCPEVKKLPRGLMNEKRTLTECDFYGQDREWWSGLMWQDDGFKSFIDSTLTPHSRKELLSSESDEEPSTFLHQ